MAMPTLDDLKEASRLEKPELFELGREADLLHQVGDQLWYHTWQSLINRGGGLTKKVTALSHDHSTQIGFNLSINLFENGDHQEAVADAHAHIASLLRQWKVELQQQVFQK